MLLEVKCLVVFKPGSDPDAVLASVVKQAYSDARNEEPTDAFVAERLRVMVRHDRPAADGGQIMVSVNLLDDLTESEAEDIRGAYLELLSKDPSIEHFCKFKDSIQMARYRQYAQEIYETEMIVREALSFIFIDTYGGGYYNLLHRSVIKPMKGGPPEQEYVSHRENQFFHLLFDEYARVNTPKPVANFPDMIGAFGRCADLPALFADLTRVPVPNPHYVTLLTEIGNRIVKMETFRNAIAHNRAHGRDQLTVFQETRTGLHAVIDAFFNALPIQSEGEGSGETEAEPDN